MTIVQKIEITTGALKPWLSQSAHVIGSRLPIAWWPVIATLLVQWPALLNAFLFDDFVHLYNVSNFSFMDAISMPMGGHLLHSFTAVVWLVKSLFGLNPFVFFLLGLTAHLTSVWLLFKIVSHLTDKEVLAAFGATLWGMSPFAAGTLGWISVHGQIYATLALLWVLLDVSRCSLTPCLLRNTLLLRHAFLLLVAATCFGAGLISTIALPLVIALWNPVPGQRNRLVAAYGTVAVAAITLYITTMMLQGDLHDNLGNKFELIQQGFVNIPATSGVVAELLSIGSATLIGGPLMVGKLALVPKELLPYVAKMVAVFATLPLLVWGCSVSAPHERRRIFALLILPCAAYGLIAIARSGGFFVLQSDTPRYHYLPQVIMAIVFCLVCSKIFDRLPAKVLNYGRISYFIWLAVVIVPFAMGPVPASKEFNVLEQNRQFIESTLAIETAIENSVDQDNIYIVNKPFKVFIWRYTPDHFPGLAGLFIISYPNNIVAGKRVYFLEESAEIVKMAQARNGTRISELLIQSPKAGR